MEKDLPLEILTHILSFLDPSHRLSAGLVCKRWLQATDTVLEDVCLTIKHSSLSRMTSRSFPRITFLSTPIDDGCIDFLNGFGPRLLHLRFLGCTVLSEKRVVNCLRLKTLETDLADVCLVFSSLPCLKSLDLRRAFDITDETLMAFDKIASPQLEKFLMPNAMVFESQICKRFYPEGTNFENLPTEFILPHQALESFVKRRAASLKTIQLPENISPEAALSLSEVGGLELHSVSFAGCEGCSAIISKFCSNHPKIVALNFDCMQRLRDEDVAAVCQLLPALREFSACHCRKIDWIVINLFRLPYLRVVRLGSCRGISIVSFSMANHPKTPLGLRTLDLSDTRIHDHQLIVLLARIPNGILVELDLSGCDFCDLTLFQICTTHTQLKSLALRGCAKIRNLGLRWVGDESGISIRRMVGLVKLDLRACTGLTHFGIMEAVRFRHLRELDLRDCPIVTSSIVTELKAHNPSLAVLRW